MLCLNLIRYLGRKGYARNLFVEPETSCQNQLVENFACFMDKSYSVILVKSHVSLASVGDPNSDVVSAYEDNIESTLKRKRHSLPH